MATAVLDRPSDLGLTYGAATLAVMWAGGAYRARICYRLSTQLPALLGQLTIATLIVAVWPGPARLRLIDHLPVTVSLVIGMRLLTYFLIRTTRAHSSTASDALIVSSARQGWKVADALLRHRECGIRPVGFIDDCAANVDSPLPVIADLAHIGEVIENLGIRHIIVAGPGDQQIDVGSALWHCRSRSVEVWVVPPLFGFGIDPCGRVTDDLWAIPFQHLRRPGQHMVARRVKRVFDIAVCVALLTMAAPFFLLVALAVRLTSPGPVLFRQRRVGQDGRELELFKFRSMVVNDDSDTTWSVCDDDRMTPIGRFLRRSCVDELPQLLNVVRGDMSLVGPRPERPHFAAQFAATVPNYTDRLRGPVGITGWAQIHGLRGDTSLAERIRFDNFYIEHWSLPLDALILARTVAVLFKWAFLGDSPDAADSEPAAVRSMSPPDPALMGPARAEGRQSA